MLLNMFLPLFGLDSKICCNATCFAKMEKKVIIYSYCSKIDQGKEMCQGGEKRQ